MIPFKNRFHGHNSLTFTYKNGQTIRTKLFTIKFCPNPRKRFSRIAVVISKKVAKHAVKRNFVRRRVYSLLHPKISQFTKNYDLIFIAHSLELAEINFSELEQKITNELQQAQIIK
ncbi:MAG: ribonuclease P protein component [Candidatus Saccharibacteria bacterium]|nr:ribonuclease P protein component [Candidatus Saccharibacteria bacterium]